MDLKQALVESAARVIDLFREWDSDGNGKVSRSEFHRAMGELKFDAAAEEVDKLFDSWDPDGSGFLELNEVRFLTCPCMPLLEPLHSTPLRTARAYRNSALSSYSSNNLSPAVPAAAAAWACTRATTARRAGGGRSSSRHRPQAATSHWQARLIPVLGRVSPAHCWSRSGGGATAEAETQKPFQASPCTRPGLKPSGTHHRSPRRCDTRGGSLTRR